MERMLFLLFVWLAIVVVESYRRNVPANVAVRRRWAAAPGRRTPTIPTTTPTTTTTSVAVLRDDSGGSDDDIVFNSLEGFTFKKRGGDKFKKSDNRDSLPFVVTYDEGGKGSKVEIGTYRLDASTACGDLLDLGGRLFEVRKVSFLYKYESGGFRVFKKKLDVSAAKASWVGGAGATGAEGGETYLQ